MTRALGEIFAEVAARLDRHPHGHLLGQRGERIGLELSLPLDHRAANGSGLAAAARGASERLDLELERAIERAVGARIASDRAFHPGRVFCHRCALPDCEHSVPRSPREVFAGYGPTGLPRFEDFGRLLLARRDPRVDELYREGPSGTVAPVVTWVTTGGELSGGLLEAFRERHKAPRLEAQVAAGWFHLPRSPRGERLAVSFQIVSLPRGGAPRQGRLYALHAVGCGPEGAPLAAVAEALDPEAGRTPWREALVWGREAVATLDPILRGGDPREARRLERERIAGIAQAIARRFERKSDKTRRAEERRTQHAAERHSEGDRPTGRALADLARAARTDFWVDLRRGTLVVLGERGRAHIYSPEGRHVTSIRYSLAALERRRREGGPWRLADDEEIERLRREIAARGELSKREAEP